MIKYFWPYRILKRADDDIKNDLNELIRHFTDDNQAFDMIVFVPNAGTYLHQLCDGIFDGSSEVNFVTVRRVSTTKKDNLLKKIIFKKKWLSDTMRHVDVLLRLIKYRLNIRQRMSADFSINFEVKGKKVLVIDDDIATGTTLEIVKSILLKHGAASVKIGCISNHFLPNEIGVDYSVYRYVLLRTKNSRDYYAS